MSFLAAVFHWFTTSANWQGADGIASRVGLQAELAAAVVVAASMTGLTAGFVLGHFGRGGIVAVNAANAARAIPSVALLTLFVLVPAIAFRWDGFLAAGLALYALAIPPILTNSYVGMREVDPEVREAARAMGLTGWQSFFKVEVPLALPLAIAGIRTAAIEVVATSTLAAYVTFNDLGEFIFAGLAVDNNVETFSGAVLVALLAGIVDVLVLGLYRLVTPAVLRRELKGRDASHGALPGAVRRAFQKRRVGLEGGPA